MRAFRSFSRRLAPAEPVNSNGSSHSVVSLTFPAKAEYIALGRLALTGLLRTRAIGPEIIADLKLALTEACSNSIRHAYAGSDGMVEIRYELDGRLLRVEVADEGGGFDPALLGADPRDIDEGGLGIAIIRALTDELDVGPREGRRGSRLRFVKQLS
jgi:serine/threonine-protein kinase RsbW